MPLPEEYADLKKQYERRAAIRAPYLTQAQDNEYYTMDTGCSTHWSSGLQAFSYASREHLFTSIGAVVVRGFSSVVTGTILPAQTTWLRYKLTGHDRDNEGEIDDALIAGEREAMDQAQASSLKSAFFQAMCAAENAGLGLMVVKRDSTDVYPLSQFCADWEGGRYRRFWVEDAREEMVGGQVKNVRIWTFANKDTGEVWQQKDGETEATRVTDMHADQFVGVSLESPFGKKAYPTPLVYYHLPLMRNSNTWTRAFNLIVIEAAKVIKGVRQGSGIDPAALERLPSGRAIQIRTPEDIVYFTVGMKINDAQMLLQAIERIDLQLKSYFHYGLMDRATDIELATAVRQIVAEMNALGSQYYAHLADHTQTEMAMALRHLTDFDVELDDGSRVIPQVLTGMSAFSRQEEAERMLGIAERCAAINPEFGTRIIDMAKFYREVARNYQISVEDVVRSMQDVESLIQSLAQKIDEDPAAAERVAAFLEQIVSSVKQPADRLPESAQEAAQLSQQ